jgi:hypothetical protein
LYADRIGEAEGIIARDAWLWRHKAKRVEITIVDATVPKPGGFQISVEAGSGGLSPLRGLAFVTVGTLPQGLIAVAALLVLSVLVSGF